MPIWEITNPHYSYLFGDSSAPLSSEACDDCIRPIMMAKLLLCFFCVLICAAKRSLYTSGANIELNSLTIAPQVISPASVKADKILSSHVSEEHNSDDDQLNNCELLDLKPICWVQKVGHLEDTLEFYERNFGLRVIHHAEHLNTLSDSGIEDLYDSAYSRTTLAPEGLDISDSFFIELLFNYGINRYRRGNDLRGLIFKSSSYKGDLNLLERDSLDQRFLQTPDGHLIIIEDDEVTIEAPLSRYVTSTIMKCGNNALKKISLHVSNLQASVEFYRDILRGNVDLNLVERSALCVWNEFIEKRNNVERTAFSSDGFTEAGSGAISTSSTADTNHWIKIELVELPATQSIDIRASQGLFVIEVKDKIVFQKMSDYAKKAENLRSSHDRQKISSHLPYPSKFQKEKKIIKGDEEKELFQKDIGTFSGNSGDFENVSITDPDGHEFVFLLKRNNVIKDEEKDNTVFYDFNSLFLFYEHYFL